MNEIKKYDLTKIVFDCLGVLYVDSNSEYNKDFRQDLVSKARKLEVFLSIDFNLNEIQTINLNFENKKLINSKLLSNLPDIKDNTENDTFFDTLRFWAAYDLSLCYAFMFEPYKTVDFFLMAYDFAKNLREVTVAQIIGRYGERMFYQLECLGNYNYEKLYKSIKFEYYFFVDTYCKIKWLFENYYNQVSDEDMITFCEHDKKYFKSKYRNKERFQIQTKEQADNLLKYKKISLERYNNTLKRLEKNKNQTETDIDLCNNFKLNYGFKKLERRINMLSGIDNEKYIPNPSWKCSLYKELNHTQKSEYQTIYYSQNILNNKEVYKYEQIRVNQIFLYFMKNPGDLSNEDLVRELNFFANIKSFKHYFLLQNIYNYLINLEKKELLKRIDLLFYLDNTSINSEDIRFSSLEIKVTESYFSFIKHSSKEISHYIKTGSFLPKITYQEHLELQRCLQSLNKYSEEAQKYYDYFYRKSDIQPEDYIQICENYINSLINNKPRWSVYGNNEYFEEAFNIGYIINDLTASCVKTKNWAKIIYWLDLFFNGDKIYSYGVSQGEIFKMKKRFETAKTKIDK